MLLVSPADYYVTYWESKEDVPKRQEQEKRQVS
jgi:hypothetical protein